MVVLNSYTDEVRELIDKNSSIYFISVLLFHAPGRVWVDDVENIKLALIYSEYQEGFQFMGNPVATDKCREIRGFYDNVILPFMKEKNMSIFEFGADSDELINMLTQIFSDKSMEKSEQLIFSCKEYAKSFEYDVTYQFVPLDELFFSCSYENEEYIRNEIVMSNWNIQRFLEKGFGYAALDGNRIISWAIVCISYGDVDNIGINTLDKYRNKGLATALANKVLEQIFEKNHIPIWDCDKNNYASKKVAGKCGFIEIRREKICYFTI